MWTNRNINVIFLLVHKIKVIPIMSVIDRIEEYIGSRKYICIRDLKDHLREENVEFEDNTVKKYLYRLTEEGKIHDAGREWYSTIKQKYNLKTGPIQEFVEKLEQKFPYLEFSVWSIRQISSHFHHLPGKFLSFIYAEKNTGDAVRDFLVEEDLHVYLDPTVEEIEKQFQLESDTYIVRPGLTEEPKEEHFARIEKILVDTFVEKNKFNFIGKAEYEHIFSDVLMNHRINIAKLLRYGKVRNIRSKIQEYVDKIAEGKRIGYS